MSEFGRIFYGICFSLAFFSLMLLLVLGFVQSAEMFFETSAGKKLLEPVTMSLDERLREACEEMSWTSSPDEVEVCIAYMYR